MSYRSSGGLELSEVRGLTMNQKQFKKELDPEFIEVIGNFAGNYCTKKGLRGVTAWSIEDLVHEMIVALKKKIDAGTLYARVNRKFLRERAIDAIRVLERGNPKFQGREPKNRERSLVYSDDLASYIDKRQCNGGKRETGEGIVSYSEALQQSAQPRTPAEKLRRKFEEEGCLWTRSFHDFLEQNICEMIREGANEMRKSSKEVLSEQVIQNWIERNPGENPTNRWLASQLGMERETVTRKVRVLTEEGRIVRQPAVRKGKLGECRTRGKWSYYPGNDAGNMNADSRESWILG
jgi:hypothetical protein